MLAPLLIGPLGPFEILVILFVGLLIFGARLPEVGRSLGKGLMEFKRGLRGMQDQLDDVDREADRQVDNEMDRRALPTNPAEENAPYKDDLDSYDPHYGDEDYEDPDIDDEEGTGEEYADDPAQEPGPEFGGDPQPDADPEPTTSTSSDADDTTVYADPEYLKDDKGADRG